MRYALVVLLGMLCFVSPAAAQVSVGIGLPGVNIGINMPSYPDLSPVPNYPVYYAPRGDVNLFFYDGMYWAYQRDNWYASSWYNGPWRSVGPEVVPLYVLRVPVRYYRHRPPAWAGWKSNAPPRWGERWGHEWERQHKGWDHWDRNTVHARAPLPAYQRNYSGDRYPREEQQQNALHNEKYRYQSKDPVVREHNQQHGAQAQPAERKRQADQRSSPAVERQPQRPPPTAVQHDRPAPRSQGQQDKSQPQHKPEQGQKKGQEREKGQNQEKGPDQERGQGHKK